MPGWRIVAEFDGAKLFPTGLRAVLLPVTFFDKFITTCRTFHIYMISYTGKAVLGDG